MKRTIAHKRLVVGEKKQRFGFRKTIFGLCGAILGSTLLMVNAANNANTVHADEYDPGQATSGQSDDSSAKGNGANTDAGKASVKTPVEVKGNEGTNTANGLNGKAVQPLAKKEVPKLNSSLKQDEKASKATHIRIRRALPTDKEALIHVTKDNFLDYFSLDGSATYDKNTGIVTITPDEYSKVGNLSLKSKIDMNTSFTLTGKVNLGSNPNGADGIGFAFHTGNTTDIGNAGGNLGIGGLQNALGFKLDTWSNGYQAPLSDKDGSQIDSTNSDDFGWNGDSMNAPYGTFVDTKNEEVFTKDGKKFKDGGLKMLLELPKR